MKCDDYIAAVYDGNIYNYIVVDWIYVGKVEEIDEDDGDCKVNFMEKAKELYRWPKRLDILWVDNGDILSKIEEPQQTGKSKRQFKLSENDKMLINGLYQGN